MAVRWTKEECKVIDRAIKKALKSKWSYYSLLNYLNCGNLSMVRTYSSIKGKVDRTIRTEEGMASGKYFKK